MAFTERERKRERERERERGFVSRLNINWKGKTDRPFLPNSIILGKKLEKSIGSKLFSYVNMFFGTRVCQTRVPIVGEVNTFGEFSWVINTL